jgi:hypothetical protein
MAQGNLLIEQHSSNYCCCNVVVLNASSATHWQGSAKLLSLPLVRRKNNILFNIRHFRLPPGSRWQLCSFGILRSVHFGTAYRSHVQWSSQDPWRWDRYVDPKRRYGITTTRCVIASNSAVLIVLISLNTFQHCLSVIMTQHDVDHAQKKEVAPSGYC